MASLGEILGLGDKPVSVAAELSLSERLYARTYTEVCIHKPCMHRCRTPNRCFRRMTSVKSVCVCGRAYARICIQVRKKAIQCVTWPYRDLRLHTSITWFIRQLYKCSPLPPSSWQPHGNEFSNFTFIPPSYPSTFPLTCIWGIIQSMVSAVRKWLLTWWTGWRAAWRPRSSCPLLPGSARPPYPAPCPARTATFAQTRRSIIDRPSHLLSLGHTQPCVETSPLYKSVTIFYLRYKF